jgi:hypothetical protein
VITRELLKKEIDNVQDEYIAPLYKIIKSFEQSDELSGYEHGIDKKDRKRKEWHKFIDKFAGSLSDTPIERGDQKNKAKDKQLALTI